MTSARRLSCARFRRAFRALRLESVESKVLISAGAHVLALLLLVNSWWIFAHRLRPPGSAHGKKTVVLSTSYAKAAPKPARPTHANEPHHSKQPVIGRNKLTEASAPSPAPHIDALGESAVAITLIQPFPTESPDLSRVGATGDVVIDLQVDELGRIAQVHTRQSMGQQIDAVVIATVERWMFQPAVRDGRPVSSEQELHFHFDRSRNAAGCSWDCFTLEAR